MPGDSCGDAGGCISGAGTAGGRVHGGHGGGRGAALARGAQLEPGRPAGALHHCRHILSQVRDLGFKGETMSAE